MKIYKKNQQSLFVKTFGIDDVLYLAATVFIYFDLNDPDHPLKEQELWSEVPPCLGPKPVLDLGQPKPRGEVLVTGQCHAPRGKTRRAGQVSVGVGGWRKTLDVYGHRQWIKAGAFSLRIGEAQPFSAMPITWENAFGGEGYAQNPLGKGFKPVRQPDGGSAHLLPNIEYPGRRIGDPDDRPAPASLGPVDMMWPPRSRKVGTYDQKWQEERWPYFPQDMNYEFFNVAPEDQMLPDFIKGGESIKIQGMHPDMPLIDSHVPRLRVRCFVTKKASLKAGEAGDHLFQEIKTHIDTLWLFPDILRGVVMFRGSIPVLDDEYEDVLRIYLANESMDEPPQTIEHYFEAQKKAMDMTVPMDQGPLEAAKEKISNALKRIKQIPKDIEAAKQKAMGNAPRTAPATPDEMANQARQMVEQGRTVLGKMEAQARQMQTKWGHMAGIPLGKFSELRSRMDQAEQKIGQSLEKIQQARQDAAKVKKQVADGIKANVPPDELAKINPDIDRMLAPPPINPWHDKGFPFVTGCRRDLEKNRDAYNWLYRLGFTRHTIRRYWLGLNLEDKTDTPPDWGIAPDQNPTGDPVELPAGLVIPAFDGPVLNRITILPQPFDRMVKGHLVKGSDPLPRFLPAVEENAPVVRVATELEAFLIEQEAGDAVGAIAWEDPSQTPGPRGAAALESAPILLVAVTPEQAKDKAVLAAWTKVFPKAQPLVLPPDQNLFQARQKGLDLRQWILDAVPQEYARQHHLDIGLPKPSQPPSGSPLDGLAFPRMNLKAMISQAINEAMAAYQPLKDSLLAEQTALESRVRDAARAAGHDPEAILASFKNPIPTSPAEETGRMIRNLTDKKHQLQRMGRLTPDAESHIDASIDQVKKLERMSEKHLADFDTKTKELEAAKVKAQSRELPEKAKIKLTAAGIDPDKIKKRSRAQVIAMHEGGQSLAGAILSGVDLSGLDLSGADFTQSQCRKTNFTGCRLAGAVFTRALGGEADFSGAVLHQAVFDKGLFQKAKFIEADLTESRLFQTVLTDADLTGADLSQATLDWTVMQRATLKKAKLVAAKAEMAVFSDAVLEEADFSQADLHKCLLKGARLDKALFLGARFDSTMIQRASGVSVNFSGANLDRVRIIGETNLAGADFRGCSLNNAYMKECDLSGAHFQNATAEKAMLESCNLSGAELQGMVARECRFNKSNLEKAKLIGINLFQGSLKKARLVRADLSLSNLYGVDFYKAVFGQTKLEQANLKATQIEGKTEFIQ